MFRDHIATENPWQNEMRHRTSFEKEACPCVAPSPTCATPGVHRPLLEKHGGSFAIYEMTVCDSIVEKVQRSRKHHESGVQDIVAGVHLRGGDKYILVTFTTL